MEGDKQNIWCGFKTALVGAPETVNDNKRAGEKKTRCLVVCCVAYTVETQNVGANCQCLATSRDEKGGRCTDARHTSSGH